MQASLSDERVRVARKREEIAEQLLRSAQARMELGATGGLEVNLAQVERGRVRGERTQAEVQLTNRHAALGILCGVTPGTPLLLTSSHTAPPQLATTDVSLPSLLAMAEAHRADLAAVRLQEQALAAEVSKLRREAVPNLVLSFDYQRDLPGQEFWGGTVGLTLPVWNRNQGPLAQVHAAELQRQAEERLLRTRIHGEVAAAQRKLVLLRSQVREFEQEVIPPAERSIELLRQGWQAGKFDLFRVITASRELAETRLRLLDLLEELWATAIETERVVGMPLLVGGSS
jgi:cobalt-zinc-cadmium efflux system outer membrane protein